MNLLSCAAPAGTLEPAPLTDLAAHIELPTATVHAFWGGDEQYFLRATLPAGDQLWFRIDTGTELSTLADGEAPDQPASFGAAGLPFSAGRVAFPVGSSGRVVYRIWRSGSADSLGGSKIRAVRAGRSRRLPE